MRYPSSIGDIVFIPSVEQSLVEGEVVRPAIYELKNELTVDEVIQLAGGSTPEHFHEACISKGAVIMVIRICYRD